MELTIKDSQNIFFTSSLYLLFLITLFYYEDMLFNFFPFFKIPVLCIFFLKIILLTLVIKTILEKSDVKKKEFTCYIFYNNII